MSDEEYESQLSANYIYMLDKQEQEIERLNNIINELDSKLCSAWQLYYDRYKFSDFKCNDILRLIEQIRKDIKELKENNNET